MVIKSRYFLLDAPPEMIKSFLQERNIHLHVLDDASQKVSSSKMIFEQLGTKHYARFDKTFDIYMLIFKNEVTMTAVSNLLSSTSIQAYMCNHRGVRIQKSYFPQRKRAKVGFEHNSTTTKDLAEGSSTNVDNECPHPVESKEEEAETEDFLKRKKLKLDQKDTENTASYIKSEEMQEPTLGERVPPHNLQNDSLLSDTMTIMMMLMKKAECDSQQALMSQIEKSMKRNEALVSQMENFMQQALKNQYEIHEKSLLKKYELHEKSIVEKYENCLQKLTEEVKSLGVVVRQCKQMSF